MTDEYVHRIQPGVIRRNSAWVLDPYYESRMTGKLDLQFNRKKNVKIKNTFLAGNLNLTCQGRSQANAGLEIFEQLNVVI